jgi:hypothetical protein
MIVKPSISFLTNDSDPQLVTDTETIVNSIMGNAGLPSPKPTMLEITAAKDEMVTAMADAAGGGVVLTAIKNAKRAVLVGLLRQLASYLQVACNDDLPLLLSSGYPIQKPQRNPIGVLPAPTISTVSFGARTGELDAVAAPVFGAAIYNWRITAAAAPGVVVQSSQTTAASNTFTGLTPGVVYNIEANVVGSAGPSNWSNPVPQMAV